MRLSRLTVLTTLPRVPEVFRQGLLKALADAVEDVSADPEFLRAIGRES